MNSEPSAQPESGIGAHPLQNVFELCREDMQRVDQFIRDSLQSEVVLINQVANYIISSGGKRLRPMLLILSARACGYRGQHHVPLAAIIEFIHTATLLHDDVVDESAIRRGQQTAHAVWGNAASVLVGDFLYSRSFQMMVQIDSMRVMQIMADATNTISEGEVLQLLNMGDPEITEASYFSVIENKTAKLFEAACRLGAVISGAAPEIEEAMAEFGNRLGLAFQITDDVLDYDGDGSLMGKNIGDDLAEGKPTLPLILARAGSGEKDRATIDQAIRNGGNGSLDRIIEIIKTTGALAGALASARGQADAAQELVAALPRTPWSAALAQLAGYSCDRNY